MGRRKLLKFSYDFLVRSMSTLDKNEGDFLGGPYFQLADFIMTALPLKGKEKKISKRRKKNCK